MTTKVVAAFLLIVMWSGLLLGQQPASVPSSGAGADEELCHKARRGNSNTNSLLCREGRIDSRSEVRAAVNAPEFA